MIGRFERGGGEEREREDVEEKPKEEGEGEEFSNSSIEADKEAIELVRDQVGFGTPEPNEEGETDEWGEREEEEEEEHMEEWGEVEEEEVVEWEAESGEDGGEEPLESGEEDESASENRGTVERCEVKKGREVEWTGRGRGGIEGRGEDILSLAILLKRMEKDRKTSLMRKRSPRE
jgi:hypothetical protein